ncbi:MAG: hypothetical protein U0414_32755 [Polyangiaceae bacterium]
MRIGSFASLLVTSALLFACGSPKHDPAPAASQTAPAASEAAAVVDPGDPAFDACAARYAKVVASEPAPGAKAYDAHRVEFLGRVRGEATVFVREPKLVPQAEPSAATKSALSSFGTSLPGIRVVLLKDRLKSDKEALRAALLREGYLYFEDPNDLFYAVEKVSLVDLFDDKTLFLARASGVFELRRGGSDRNPVYEFVDGPDKGRSASLWFGDRIGLSREALAEPLHRDFATVADTEGFDRVDIERLTTTEVAAKIRYGSTWAKAVLAADGAAMKLACLAEPKATRDQIAGYLAETAWRRSAVKNLRGAVAEAVFEALPFDRPRGVTGPDRDGELRPYWFAAYMRGDHAFSDDGDSYPVYRADGRVAVPTVCMDFVLDSFERAAGSWYAPRGEKPGRSTGRLSWDSFNPENKRGVVGFGMFAEKRTDLFEVRRFVGQERTPFQERQKFFTFIADHTDLFQPGDILSIQGLKRDDRVHQHAILLERTDPLTGFPFGLADQMSNPRRRSWEGIMAEAPKRSLYYRARPLPIILEKLATP